MKKKTLGIVGGVIALALAGGLVANFALDESRVDTKTIGVTSYQIAAFDTGTQKIDKEDDAHILSDLIATDGLTITTSEDSNVEYVLHWFNEDKDYISTSEAQTGDWTGSVASGAEYVRIEIDPVRDEDGVVSLLELPGYVAQLEVTVNK